MKVNEATGEVTGTLHGIEFRFKATLPRVADLQAALDVRGFLGIFRMIESADVRAVYHGLRLLCVSGNEKLFNDMILGNSIKEAAELVGRTLAVGLPEPDEDQKKE